MRNRAEEITSAMFRKLFTFVFLCKMYDPHFPLNFVSNQSVTWVHLIGGNSVKLLAVIMVDFTLLSL